MTRSLGIDLSSQGTGLVALESNGSPRPHCLLEEEVAFPALRGMDRYRMVVARTMERIVEVCPDRIVVEGYSLNLKNTASVVPLVELGGILRLMLHLDHHKWMDPRAGQLKQFACGKGNAKKDAIMMYVLKRWGHESKTNNIADAYVLACIGLAHAGCLPGLNKEALSVVGALPLRDR